MLNPEESKCELGDGRVRLGKNCQGIVLSMDDKDPEHSDTRKLKGIRVISVYRSYLDALHQTTNKRSEEPVGDLKTWLLCWVP